MSGSVVGRLLVWYTTMLVVVVAAFGGIVCCQAWRSRIVDIDAQLRARVNQIAAALRPAGDGMFDFILPSDAIDSAGAGPQSFHALWDATGRIIDRSDPDLKLAPQPSPGARTVDGHREMAIRTDAGALIVVGRDL